MISLKKGPRAINHHIKSKFFEILNNTATLHSYDTNANNEQAYDEHSNPIPFFMCAWLAGAMQSEEIRTLVLNTIEQFPEWFDHPAEQKAISNLVTMVFTPESFIRTRKLYTNGITFIKACKKQGHKVYVLSNWDIESFKLLKKKYPQLFNLFDGIVISGKSKSLKPSPTIYTTLLAKYALDPRHCWFIDDQQENVSAACSMGIKGILCHYTWPWKKPNFYQIAKTIKLTHYKSVTRRENRKNTGTNPSITKNNNNPIIDGEKIS